MNLDPEALDEARLWIVGATGQVGRSVALAAAGLGAQLVLTSSGQDDLEALAEEIRALGGYATIAPADVSKEADVRAAAEGIAELLEGLDGLVDAAGVHLDRGPLLDEPVETLNRSWAVNVRGAYLVARAAAPLMPGCGRIVHVVSPGAGAFGVTQAARAALSEVLAAELVAHGVRVNAIDPSPLDDESVEVILALATLDVDGPTGQFFGPAEES